MDPFIVDDVFDGPGLGVVDPLGATAFAGVLGLFVVLVVVILVVSIVLAVRRAGKLRDAGIDPLDPTTDLQIRYMQRTGTPPGTPPASRPAPAARGGAPEPRRTVEERLAEVDRLHEAGTVTAAERDAARTRILGDL